MPVRRFVVGPVAAVLALTAAARAADAPLPLERVVLFTSGVGYFQHEGTVAGDATVEM